MLKLLEKNVTEDIAYFFLLRGYVIENGERFYKINGNNTLYSDNLTVWKNSTINFKNVRVGNWNVYKYR